jgi:two-component system sensor histidine kinase UhpB
MIRTIEEDEQSKLPAFELVDHLSTQNFPNQVTNPLLYICQEALRNVMYHAAAKTVTIELSNTKEDLFLSIRDDGKGFLFPRKPSDFVYQNHFGIISMLNRIQNLNGEIDFITQPGAGTLIKIRVPLTERKVTDEP